MKILQFFNFSLNFFCNLYWLLVIIHHLRDFIISLVIFLTNMIRSCSLMQKRITVTKKEITFYSFICFKLPEASLYSHIYRLTYIST